MICAEPVAYFITWTVYGTFLQGDQRGWRKRGHGTQTPQPRLEHWHQSRLNHSIKLLDASHRRAVAIEIERFAAVRGWNLLATNVRSNHVHVVVAALQHSGAKIRDQMKANCTRVLRESWSEFVDRPVWTVGGDVRNVNSEEELERVLFYVNEAQDRKHLDE